MNSVGIGVIGCGRRIRHLLGLLLNQTNQVRLAGVCDPRNDAMESYRSKFNPDAKVYNDYREMLDNPEIEWVMIGSWNCFHKEHTVAAFRAGKHVFCEKPLATTIDDCIAMRDAWQQSRRMFSIGFTLRYSPHYIAVKRLLNENAIGDLISMEFNETLGFNHGGYIMGDWRRQTSNAGSHLLEKCCHDIDLVNWMVGSNARSVASFGGRDFFVPENRHHIERIGRDKGGATAYLTWGAEKDPFTSDKDIIDNQVAIMEFDNNVRATFHTNCNSGIPERRMYLVGTEGAIRADVITGKLEVCRIGFDAKIEDRSTTASGGHGGGDEHLIKNLVDSILHGAKPHASLEDGLRSAVTCFGIDQAMISGRVVSMRPLWERVGIGLKRNTEIAVV